MPLKVVRRKSTGALTISGTVAGQRVQRRAQSDSQKLAEEEATVLEAEILRTKWYGERRGSRSFARAAQSYLDAALKATSPESRKKKRLLSKQKSSEPTGSENVVVLDRSPKPR
jgi:hypothetical protein